MTSLYYDLDGKAIKGQDPIMIWADLIKSPRRLVGRNDLFPQIRVSTVWLGLDHNFGGGKPLIFETMIFLNHRSMEMWRYGTRKEAEEGHQRALELVKNPFKRILYIITHLEND